MQKYAMVHLESEIRSTRDAQLSLFLIVDCQVDALWSRYED